MRRLSREAKSVRGGRPPREIHVKPGRSIEAILNSLDGPTALFLEAGDHYLFESPMTISVPDCIIYGHKHAIIRRMVASTQPMVLVTGVRCVLDDIVLQDDAGGGGDALRLRNTSYCELRHIRIPAGPGGGVVVGNGIFLENASNCELHGCVVGADATRPNPPAGAEIWLDDNSLKCRVESCDADGGVISYLGPSGSVNDGACIPAVTVR